MGKRSNFERVERDFYPTPYEAVVPLLPHLPDKTVYDEPCAGEGHLIKFLWEHGHECDYAWDISPPKNYTPKNALDLTFCGGDMFITNPPYDWKILNPLITHLSDIAQTWLLLPADMMHNIRMGPHMKRCVKIVSVGRVKWFGNQAGKENSAWYLFDAKHTGPTTFVGRS